MIRLSKSIFYLTMVFAFIASCSNAPDQPSNFNDGPTRTNVLNPTNIKSGTETITKVENKVDGYIAEEGSPNFDAIINKNGSQPIFYGKGAAGITFETEFEDSKKILAKPAFGPTSAGEAQYNEQIFIQWRTEGEKKTPLFILTFKGYKGEVPIEKQVGGVTTPIGMSENYESYMGDNPEQGAYQLAIDVYQAILGTDENCLETGICRVNWGDEFATNFTVEMPGLILLISRDRFEVFRSLVRKTVPQGPMANHFDIFTSQFLYPESDLLRLGETFEKFDGTILEHTATLADVEFEINTDSFGRGYDGIFLLYHKSDFARESIQPKPTDKIMAINLYDQYRHGIFIDQAPVFVLETENNAVITDSSTTDLANARIIPLQINMALQSQNVRPFAENLMEHLIEEAKKKYSMVSGRMHGMYSLSPLKEYSAEVIGYDEETKKGIFISFRVDEQYGNIGNFLTWKLDHSLNTSDSITIPVYSSEAPVEKQVVPGTQNKDTAYTVLSGIPLNTLVKVTEQDFLGRKEATIELMKTTQNAEGEVTSLTSALGGPERSGYNDVGQFYTPNADNDLIARDQHYTSIGTLGISLGLIPVASGDGVLYGRVVSVTSALLNGPLKDICGLKLFAPRMGMKVDAFLSELQKFIQSENKSCRYFKGKDSGSNGQITSVYFPDDNMRVDFGDNELSQVTIWLPENKIEPLKMVGGAQ